MAGCPFTSTFLYLYIYRLKQNQHKKREVHSEETESTSPRWIPTLIVPDKDFLTVKEGIRPCRTVVPNIHFYCASFLWKANKQGLVIKTSHILVGDLYSLNRFSRSVCQPYRSCKLLSLNLCWKGKGEKTKDCWVHLAFTPCCFQAVPLKESLQPLIPWPDPSEWYFLCFVQTK